MGLILKEMKCGMNAYRHRIVLLLLAFIIPFVILLLLFLAVGIAPFGNTTLVLADAKGQYISYFSFYQKLLQGEADPFYSFSKILGGPIAGLYAYYLASPLNWLVVLAPEGMVIEFMTILIVIRTGLCGASMAYYLMSYSKENGFGAFMCGLLYALSGYTCAYYWNLMWFDSIALFPIIVLGLEKLIRGEGGLLYGASLGFAIFSNYYISIPICMFLVIYFFA